MKYDHPDAIWQDVVKCALHSPHTFEGCAMCEAEVEERGKRLTQMEDASTGLMRDILTHDQNFSLPQHVILGTRIEVLLDSIMQDPKDRLRFEGEVGRRLILMLKDIQKQVKQPSLFVPGRNGRQS